MTTRGDLERDLARRALRVAAPAFAYWLVEVGESNTLLSSPATIKGLRFPTSATTAVPSVAPTSLAQSASDGICAGRLLRPDGVVGDLIWLVAWASVGSPPTQVVSPYGGALPAGLIARVFAWLEMPYPTASSATTTRVVVPGAWP